MTTPAASSAGLPIVNQALEPSWVRNGSAATKKDYETALSFEQELVEQLSRSLTATSGLGGEGGEGEGGEEAGSGGAANGVLSSMLPQALTNGVMSGGGLGLAGQMTREQEGLQDAAERQASGGTAPVAPASGGSGAATPASATAAGDAVGASGGSVA